MAAAAIVLGRVPGVLDPRSPSVIPKPTGQTVVLDSGANLDVKPEHLVQFAAMGACSPRSTSGSTEPESGCFRSERNEARDVRSSGTPMSLLEAAAPSEFVGNVEGRDVGSDRADVIVTDGFTGNVLLKTTEGVARWWRRWSPMPSPMRSPDVRVAGSRTTRTASEPHGLREHRRRPSPRRGGCGGDRPRIVDEEIDQERTRDGSREGADHDLVRRIRDRVSPS